MKNTSNPIGNRTREYKDVTAEFSTDVGPWPSLLFAGLWPRSPVFDPRPVHMWSVVHKGTQRQDIYSPSTSIFPCHCRPTIAPYSFLSSITDPIWSLQSTASLNSALKTRLCLCAVSSWWLCIRGANVSRVFDSYVISILVYTFRFPAFWSPVACCVRKVIAVVTR